MANYDNRKSYNNKPLQEGETMIPIFISDWEMVKTCNMDRNNMETWRVGGQKITVAFTPARIEQKEVLMSLFWNDVREYILSTEQLMKHSSGTTNKVFRSTSFSDLVSSAASWQQSSPEPR